MLFEHLPYKFLCENLLSVILAICQGVELLDCMAILSLGFWETAQLLCQWLSRFTCLPAVWENSRFPIYVPTLVIFLSFPPFMAVLVDLKCYPRWYFFFLILWLKTYMEVLLFSPLPFLLSALRIYKLIQVVGIHLTSTMCWGQCWALHLYYFTYGV